MSRTDRLVDRRRRSRLSFSAFVGVLVVVTSAAAAWRAGVFGGGAPGSPAGTASPAAPGPEASSLDPAGSPSPNQPGPTTSPVARDPAAAKPINTAFDGLTTFRGNATRTYYGEGPVPEKPEILWRYPGSGGLCSESSDKGETKVWCGTGWTGQPNVVELEDGSTQVRFGAYDRRVHVLNGLDGDREYKPFKTGDIIKGTVTSDPDGFPLLYTGSRDNNYRILALDRGREMAELWKVHADSAPRQVWNDDWDSSGLIIRDHLLVGGENSWFYVIKLNRRYGADGKVQVKPRIKAVFPGFDDELLSDLGDNEVSIENSPSFRDGVVYFANSGGLVQGWDIDAVLRGNGKPKRVFRYWTGEDTDASVVIDDEGFLYVASELERFNARAAEAGQFVKLDPRKPNRPVVWKRKVGGRGGTGGAWATPGLYRGVVFLTTNTGRLLAVDRISGKRLWQKTLPPPTWTSPVIVDGVLIVGDCEGYLRAYDVADPTVEPPREKWKVKLEGCIESTPAVWRGRIYVGARGGGVYGIGDPI